MNYAYKCLLCVFLYSVIYNDISQPLTATSFEKQTLLNPVIVKLKKC